MHWARLSERCDITTTGLPFALLVEHKACGYPRLPNGECERLLQTEKALDITQLNMKIVERTRRLRKRLAQSGASGGRIL